MQVTAFWSHPSAPVCDMQQSPPKFWVACFSTTRLGCTSSLRSVLSVSPSSLPQNQETWLSQPPSPGLGLRLGVLVHQGLHTLLSHISEHGEGGLHDEVDETCGEGEHDGEVHPEGWAQGPARLEPPAAGKTG